MKNLTWLAAMAIAIASPAQAQDVPATVGAVISGGTWSQTPDSGTYRVIVSNSGFDHVVSTVRVEWIAAPTSNRPSKVISSTVVELPEPMSVAVKFGRLAPNKAEVSIEGTNPYSLEKRQLSIFATQPGHLSK